MACKQLMLLVLALCGAQLVLGDSHSQLGDMMNVRKKMGGYGGTPSLTWNINIGGGGKGMMSQKKAMMIMGFMTKTSILGYEMTKPYCKDKCVQNGDDCPAGESEDMMNRNSACRICVLECVTCKSEGFMAKLKNKMKYKAQMKKEGKGKMMDLSKISFESMMRDMAKKTDDGKTMMDVALDTMKEDQTSLMNSLGMDCGRFWPSQEEQMEFGMKFYEKMKEGYKKKKDDDM